MMAQYTTNQNPEIEQIYRAALEGNANEQFRLASMLEDGDKELFVCVMN